MNYRILPVEEWTKLKEILPSDFPPPNPLASSACVAETPEGKIVGVLFLQLAFHMEPMVIDRDHRGKVNFLRLAQTLEKALLEESEKATYYVFSPNKRTDKMSAHNGLTPKGWAVWSKDLEREVA